MPLFFIFVYTAHNFFFLVPPPLSFSKRFSSYGWIDLMGGSNGELQDLTNRLVDRASAYGMKDSRKKSEIMTNSTNNTSADIGMNGRTVELVTSFKYLGATLCKDGTCSAEVRIRIASATAAMARLKRIWQCNTISFASKLTLHNKSVAVKQGPCLLTPRKGPRLSKEHNTNDWVRSKANFLVGPQEPLPATVRRQKLEWFRACHTPRHPLQKPFFTAPWRVGGRCDRQRKCWMDNIKDWTSCPCQNCSQKRLEEDLC